MYRICIFIITYEARVEVFVFTLFGGTFTYDEVAAAMEQKTTFQVLRKIGER